MKRILLLIVLVMMVTYFLRDREERPRYRGMVEAPRLKRQRAPKPQASLGNRPNVKVVEAEWTEPSAPAPVDPPIRKISSQMMATEERAKADAIRKLGAEVSLWLEPEVPTDWKAPAPLVQSMIREVAYTPVAKDYGTLYIAEISADTSARRREAIIRDYHREAVHRRMMALGGSLTLVLICLGAISGYIRADEATKGYYTNRLRLLAAAGVGAAGVAVYRLI